MATVDQPDPPVADPRRLPLAPPPIDRGSLNLPNAITLSRLVLAIVLFAIIGYDGLWLTAAGLFVFAVSTDALDGYLARKYGQVTTLGRILDPFVDKIIICGAFIFLMDKAVTRPNPAGGPPLVVGSGVTAWMTLIVVSREMFVTSLRGFMEQHGIDFSADNTGKVKMVLQCIAVTVSLLSLSRYFTPFPNFALFRDVVLWGTAAFTAYSGVAYFGRAMRALRATRP